MINSQYKPYQARSVTRRTASLQPAVGIHPIAAHPAFAPFIQMKNSCVCGGGCPRCLSGQHLQAKLKVGAHNDIYEQEADQVADQVMRMAETVVNHPLGGEQDGKNVRTKQYSAGQAKLTTTNLYHSLQSQQGGGRLLSCAERSFFEPRFGHDFSRVRIHDDARAQETAQGMNARAFTIGGDIFLGRHAGGLNTDEGRRLFSHELVHVLQQKGEKSQSAGMSLQRAVTYDDCSTGQQSIVLDSHNRAREMLRNAITKLSGYNGTTPADVATSLRANFHGSSRILAGIILRNILQVWVNSDSPQYECESVQEGTTLAWAMWCVPFTDIELYPNWFSETDIDIRARTMIHEWFHRYACMFDLGYHWEAEYPSHGTIRALNNADPYAYLIYEIR